MVCLSQSPHNSTESGMRPWSGQRRILLYSEQGCDRGWTLPEDWAHVGVALLYPLTPDGRGEPVRLTIEDQNVAPGLLRRVPYVLVPVEEVTT